MSKDYNKSAATAQRLIKKFGVSASFRRIEGTEDPLKPWEGETDTEVGYPTTACLIPLSATDIKLMPDGTSLDTAQRCLMEAVDLKQEPTVGDAVLIDGVTWQIINVVPLKPSTINVFWDMIVRK
jgi:hypothetical protein